MQKYRIEAIKTELKSVSDSHYTVAMLSILKLFPKDFNTIAANI